MKYVIDTDKLDQYNITKDELLYCLSLYWNAKITNSTVTSCNMKGMLYTDLDENNQYVISLNKTGTDTLESYFSDCQIVENKEGKDRFEILADKLREIYPKGKKDGTAYQWRDSTKIIANKLKAVVRYYKTSFTDEEAITATKKYVEGFNGNYTYMQLLKYFISKKEMKNGELVESSQLLSYIENAGQEEELKSDWTSTLK